MQLIIIRSEAGAKFSFPRNFHTIYCFLYWLLSIFCLTAKTAIGVSGLIYVGLRRIARHSSRCENVISFLSLVTGPGLSLALLRLGTHTGYWQWTASAGRHGAHLSAACTAQLPGPKRHSSQQQTDRYGCTDVLSRLVTWPGPSSGPAACLADWSRGRDRFIACQTAALWLLGLETLNHQSRAAQTRSASILGISAANTASVPPPGRSAQPFTHQQSSSTRL